MLIYILIHVDLLLFSIYFDNQYLFFFIYWLHLFCSRWTQHINIYKPCVFLFCYDHNFILSIYIYHFLSMMDSKMAIDGFSYHLFLCDDDQFTWINLSMWMSPLGSIWYGIILSIRVHDLWTCVHLQSSFVPEGRWYDMMIIMDGNRWINMK